MSLHPTSPVLLLILLALTNSYFTFASTPPYSSPAYSTPTYPSCLEGDTSWPASQITSSTSGVASPEDCQVRSCQVPQPTLGNDIHVNREPGHPNTEDYNPGPI